ncbi:MBL fold metallo-hydrolase [Microbulbifer pacificus]|uniref:MBL fold metallo-hydrolase n=1 Tax=Microbulbifer pacificus TaxID=407164 RepID=A0AAU0MY39_9GAMM|nr:MBL fold metallo-hydrolase [Microbulbifer pacificus]WOX04739.1 MBL fold metallo-hydrolase [Microbulbifer pacificus]
MRINIIRRRSGYSRKLALAASIALLIGNTCNSATPAASASAIHLTPVQISENSWYFEGVAGLASADNQGFMSNSGFVITENGVVVYDALATPALAQAMLDAIAKLTALPVTHVIVSHYHADHIYGLQVLKDAGATVIAKRSGQTYIGSEHAQRRLQQRRESLSPWVNDKTRLIGADIWLDFQTGPRYRLQLGDIAIDIIDGGFSHSPDDILLSIPSESVLFAGDIFSSGRLPFLVDGNTETWLHSMEAIAKLGATVIVPGHGHASKNPADDIQLNTHYIRFLRQQMGAAAEELRSFNDAYDATDWSEFRDVALFDAANRRNAYHVFLEMQQALFE